MNKWRQLQNQRFGTYQYFIRFSRHNLFLAVGFYGLCLILLFVLFAPLATPHAIDLYSNHHLLPPAWDEQGNLTHLLGVDQNGKDIFDHLLYSTRATVFITFLLTLSLVLTGSIITMLGIVIKPLSYAVFFILRIITIIPVLLLIMIVAIVSGNTIIKLAVVVAVTMLPRFTYNIHNLIQDEINRFYILALRLDGLSPISILWNSLIPNIWPKYIIECINIYCLFLLAFTTLTFLRFGRDSGDNELGIMMREMIAILPFNKWGFISPGLTILIIILLLNLLNFGLEQFSSRKD